MGLSISPTARIGKAATFDAIFHLDAHLFKAASNFLVSLGSSLQGPLNIAEDGR